jgi:hypothetical protein
MITCLDEQIQIQYIISVAFIFKRWRTNTTSSVCEIEIHYVRCVPRWLVCVLIHCTPQAYQFVSRSRLVHQSKQRYTSRQIMFNNTVSDVTERTQKAGKSYNSSENVRVLCNARILLHVTSATISPTIRAWVKIIYGNGGGRREWYTWVIIIFINTYLFTCREFVKGGFDLLPILCTLLLIVFRTQCHETMPQENVSWNTDNIIRTYFLKTLFCTRINIYINILYKF